MGFYSPKLQAAVTGLYGCQKDIPLNYDNKPWAYICSRGFFRCPYFRVSLYIRRVLLLEVILHFKLGWPGFNNNKSLKH